MFDYSDLYTRISQTALAPWLTTLPSAVANTLLPEGHGHLREWQALLSHLPDARPSVLDFSADCVRIGNSHDVGQITRSRLEELLHGLHPWRKGPFCLFDIHIDTEWRSDWKWNRLIPHIQSLEGRRVLDVGCGNGYYAWRMLGAGAAEVIGLDPTLVYVMQYWAVRRYTGPQPAWVLPLGIERLPEGLSAFDTLFSMGVLYHRRDPQEHLRTLLGALRPGGELVLETLVLEGTGQPVLVPQGRYAKMRNVWAIPACETVENWLEEAGFGDVRCVDMTRTTTAEQRSTDWMRFQSLSDFLDPNDPTRTVEGLPAPVRAVFIARRP